MNHKSIVLLLIDDNEKDTASFQKLLQKRKEVNGITYEISHVETLKQALLLIPVRSFDLIVSSLALPDSKGVETLQALKKAAEKIPLIIIVGATEEEEGVEMIRQGAQDVLFRGELKKQLLDRTIRHAIERHQLQMKLRMQTFTDDLTHLYNRRGFITLIEQQIELANRSKRGFSLFFIDLDSLKEINDNFGHQEGDNALTRAAECLRQAFRHSDILCRLGGDEFAAVALGTTKEGGNELRYHLYEILRTYNKHKTHSYNLSFTLGLSFYDPSHPTPIEELLETADKDLYSNKKLRQKGKV